MPIRSNNSLLPLLLTFNSHRHGLYFASKNSMQILAFPVARNGHAGGKECDVPQEGEAHSEHGVGAKDLDRTEGTDNADKK